MAGDGWLAYHHLFDDGGNWVAGWGHPTPNNTGAICDIVSGEGGPDQGAQQLVAYSNYGVAEHGNPGWVLETNLYKEWPVAAGEGYWYFAFDAKMGNLEGSSEAYAFIKVLDPGAGWATTQFITADMTSTPSTWTRYGLEVDLSGSAGQIVQIGFMNLAGGYEGSGIFYDNLDFGDDPAVATEDNSMSSIKALY